MQIQELNNIANDLAVLRSDIKYSEEEMQAMIEQNPDIRFLQQKIDQKKKEKEVIQGQLLVAMQDQELKSWKTEHGMFSRSTRYSVLTDPIYTKQLLGRLKDGEKMEGHALKETEFISIRSVKK